jgi:hypothetical protein
MQTTPDKKTSKPTISQEQETLYDLELSRKAKEVYGAFADKVAKTNLTKNPVIHYPVHWQYQTYKEKKDPKKN